MGHKPSHVKKPKKPKKDKNVAAVVITAQNIRLDDAEATTQWGDILGGQGGGLETDFKYQDANCYARKGGTAQRGIFMSDNVDSDLSGAGTHETVMFKYICTTPGLLDLISVPGMRLEIGSGSIPATESSDFFFYDVQGADTYPIDKSWLVLPINPTVISHRSGQTGSPDLTLVDYFGLEYDQTGTSKSPNQAMDAVDIGDGLTLAGGDGGDADGLWQDFSDFDFGTNTNRFGYVREIDGASEVFLIYGQMVIGTSAATVFNDTAKTLIFPDGLFASGFSGITVDLQNASTDVDFVDSNFFGKGARPGEDTRPTLLVTGTSGDFDADGCVFDRFSRLTLTSAATLLNCTLSNCERVVLGGGTLDGCLIFGATTEELAGLAFVEGVGDSLEKYNFDGEDWSRRGNGLFLSPSSTLALTALSGTRVAYYDSLDNVLETYDFDGTDWSKTGNSFSLTAGFPSLATLSSTRVAFFDATNDEIQAFDFDGTDWTATGNPLSVSALVGTIAGLSSNRVALYTNTSDELRAYDFDGTDWTATGNLFSISGGGIGTLTALSSNRVAFYGATAELLEAYDFDGTDWTKTGNSFSISGGSTPALAGLSSNRVAFFDSALELLEAYDFDGLDWTKTGNSLLFSGAGGSAMAFLSDEQAAFILATSLGNIKNCDFTFSAGHAIEITATGTYTFNGNGFTGYGANDTTDAAIFNNSGGLVTINVGAGGSTPTIRNGSGASTVVNNNVSLTFAGLRDNTEVRVYTAGTTTELAGVENATDGSSDNRSVTFSLAASISVDIRFAHGIAADGNVYRVPDRNSILAFTWPTTTTTLPITQVLDRNFDDPA